MWHLARAFVGSARLNRFAGGKGEVAVSSRDRFADFLVLTAATAAVLAAASTIASSLNRSTISLAFTVLAKRVRPTICGFTNAYPISIKNKRRRRFL